MDNPYLPIITALAELGIGTYFQSDDQLVVSRQGDPAWPDAGNSFWISRKNDRWYLCTWLACCYLLPSSADLVALSAEFAARGNTAQPVVPSDLIQKYRLTQLDESAAAVLFEWDSDEGVDDDADAD